jgi:hypothetical protein
MNVFLNGVAQNVPENKLARYIAKIIGNSTTLFFETKKGAFRIVLTENERADLAAMVVAKINKKPTSAKATSPRAGRVPAGSKKNNANAGASLPVKISSSLDNCTDPKWKRVLEELGYEENSRKRSKNVIKIIESVFQMYLDSQRGSINSVYGGVAKAENINYHSVKAAVKNFNKRHFPKQNFTPNDFIKAAVEKYHELFDNVPEAGPVNESDLIKILPGTDNSNTTVVSTCKWDQVFKALGSDEKYRKIEQQSICIVKSVLQMSIDLHTKKPTFLCRKVADMYHIVTNSVNCNITNFARRHFGDHYTSANFIKDAVAKYHELFGDMQESGSTNPPDSNQAEAGSTEEGASKFAEVFSLLDDLAGDRWDQVLKTLGCIISNSEKDMRIVCIVKAMLQMNLELFKNKKTNVSVLLDNIAELHALNPKSVKNAVEQFAKKRVPGYHTTLSFIELATKTYDELFGEPNIVPVATTPIEPAKDLAASAASIQSAANSPKNNVSANTPTLVKANSFLSDLAKERWEKVLTEMGCVIGKVEKEDILIVETVLQTKLDYQKLCLNHIYNKVTKATKIEHDKVKTAVNKFCRDKKLFSKKSYIPMTFMEAAVNKYFELFGNVQQSSSDNIATKDAVPANSDETVQGGPSATLEADISTEQGVAAQSNLPEVSNTNSTLLSSPKPIGNIPIYTNQNEKYDQAKELHAVILDIHDKYRCVNGKTIHELAIEYQTTEETINYLLFNLLQYVRDDYWKACIMFKKNLENHNLERLTG